MAIIQFKISLLGSQPLIWRRFQVRDDYRMDRFHQVIQIVMGWDNKHLHEFHLEGRRIGMVLDGMDDFEGENLEDENQLFLKDLQFKAGDRFGYWYDFGDDWKHVLEVEAITEGSLDVPLLLDGEQACPQEDCGGIGGHQSIINFLKDPVNAEDQYWREWLPEDYDPADFSVREANAELTKFGKWHNRYPKKRSTPWHQVD